MSSKASIYELKEQEGQEQQENPTQKLQIDADEQGAPTISAPEQHQDKETELHDESFQHVPTK